VSPARQYRTFLAFAWRRISFALRNIIEGLTRVFFGRMFLNQREAMRSIANRFPA